MDEVELVSVSPLFFNIINLETTVGRNPGRCQRLVITLRRLKSTILVELELDLHLKPQLTEKRLRCRLPISLSDIVRLVGFISGTFSSYHCQSQDPKFSEDFVRWGPGSAFR
jgi:hypothetical protein